MMLAEKLEAEGIRLRSYRLGTTKILCPRCSADRRNKREPCLSVTIDAAGATWKCHNCNWTGGASDRNSGFKKASRAPPVRPSYRVQEAPDPTIEWFSRRCISRSTVEGAKITRADEWMPGDDPGQASPVICFPFFRGEECINVKFRSKDKRFKQVKGAEKIYYGLEQLGDTKEVYIVEGEMDALSLREIGRSNVLSVPDGAPREVKEETPSPEDDTKFSYVWNCVEDLAGVEKFILATDADEPGKALAEELARRYGRERCWRVTWPEHCKDANDVLCNLGPDALNECLDNAKPWPIQDLHEVADYAEEVFELYRAGRQRALSTGWPGLDKLMTIAEGQLSVVTGIPNSGKSEFVDAIMVNMAEQHDWSFAVCSFENPPAEHISKIAEKHLALPFWDGQRARMGEGDLASAIDWASRHFVFIRAHGDDTQTSLDWVLEKARAAVMRYGVRGVVIDPWNEIEHNRPSNMTETEYIGQALVKIKRFAATRGVHVWVVAHPQKIRAIDGGPTPPPGLYDINGSANWANKADLGVVVYRHEEEGKNYTEVFLRKVRFKSIGQKGSVEFDYDRATGIYSERASAQEEEAEFV